MTHPKKAGPVSGRKRFLLGELIGEKTLVAKSSCKDLQGITGLVLDETTNTFLLQTKSGVKRILKKGSTFFFPSADAEVDGMLLICRPEERTKKLFHKLK